MERDVKSLAEQLREQVGDPPPKPDPQQVAVYALVAIAVELGSIRTVLEGIRDDLGPDQPGEK